MSEWLTHHMLVLPSGCVGVVVQVKITVLATGFDTDNKLAPKPLTEKKAITGSEEVRERMMMMHDSHRHAHIPGSGEGFMLV